MIKDIILGEGMCFEALNKVLESLYPSADKTRLQSMIDEHTKQYWTEGFLAHILGDIMDAGIASFLLTPHPKWGSVPSTIDFATVQVDMCHNTTLQRDFRYLPLTPGQEDDNEREQKQHSTNADAVRAIDIPSSEERVKRITYVSKDNNWQSKHLMGRFIEHVETIVFEPPDINGVPTSIMMTARRIVMNYTRVQQLKIAGEENNLIFFAAVAQASSKDAKAVVGEAIQQASLDTQSGLLLQGAAARFGETPNALNVTKAWDKKAATLEDYRNNLAAQSAHQANMQIIIEQQRMKAERMMSAARQAMGAGPQIMDIGRLAKAESERPESASQMTRLLTLNAEDQITPFAPRAAMPDFVDASKLMQGDIHNLFRISRELLSLDDEGGKLKSAEVGIDDSREKAKKDACNRWMLRLTKIAEKVCELIYGKELEEDAIGDDTRVKLGVQPLCVFWGMLDWQRIEDMNNKGMIAFETYRRFYAAKHHVPLSAVLEETIIPEITSVGHPLGWKAMMAQTLMEAATAESSEETTTASQTGENKSSSTKTKTSQPTASMPGNKDFMSDIAKQFKSLVTAATKQKLFTDFRDLPHSRDAQTKRLEEQLAREAGLYQFRLPTLDSGMGRFARN
jgi:hypothetical protein